jgi:diadenosine tetraphosphatase ApaH/serine/threonine PP2A family protein phosphatase
MPGLLTQWRRTPVQILAAKAHKQTILEARSSLQHCHWDPVLREFAGSRRTRRTAADDHDLALILHDRL